MFTVSAAQLVPADKVLPFHFVILQKINFYKPWKKQLDSKSQSILLTLIMALPPYLLVKTEALQDLRVQEAHNKIVLQQIAAKKLAKLTLEDLLQIQEEETIAELRKIVNQQKTHNQMALRAIFLALLALAEKDQTTENNLALVAAKLATFHFVFKKKKKAVALA